MKNSQRKFIKPFLKSGEWLEGLSITLWGALLLKYWLTSELYILIHPNYFILTIAGGFILLGLGSWKLWQSFRQYQNRLKASQLSSQLTNQAPEQLIDQTSNDPKNQHITFFPPNLSNILLLTTAVIGLTTTPQVFASETALQRGLTESLPVTRLQTQNFRTATKPGDRSLVEWVRTLNAYPEPDAYTNQPVKVTGFVLHPPGLSEQYFWIARFILTCCAADAYPIGLPVKIEGGNSNQYARDTWIELTGNMITQELNGKRQLTILAKEIKPIPKPKNPYEY
jgi:uncharacterized repeat protein (TIGR03943 family)